MKSTHSTWPTTAILVTTTNFGDSGAHVPPELPILVPSGSLASIGHVSALSDLPRIASGKVREIYDLGERLLLVASDRISTYDVVHPTAIPDKGAVLTGLSTFWFERTAEIVPNHLISVTDDVPEEARGRAMVVRKLEMLPIECVVRGYLSGSGWSDYQRTGQVCGIAVPSGLTESEQLPEPIFTPATKAQEGHDENIDFDRAAQIVGDRDLLERARAVSIALYEHAAEHARSRGIVLADTKFELGIDSSGRLTVGDEVCTPDSSRFWPADQYEPGRPQPSFDKQFVRDWASSTGWDRTPPAPAIPQAVVDRTRAKYREAYERITGEPFSAWLERTGAR
jgi:phosphoribosylaminoimidazole-succinocarboxamide synthase